VGKKVAVDAGVVTMCMEEGTAWPARGSLGEAGMVGECAVHWGFRGMGGLSWVGTSDYTSQVGDGGGHSGWCQG